jgi:hypothetical protein
VFFVVNAAGRVKNFFEGVSTQMAINQAFPLGGHRGLDDVAGENSAGEKWRYEMHETDAIPTVPAGNFV